MLAVGDTRGARWPELADAMLDTRLSETGRLEYAEQLRSTLLDLQRRVVVLSPSAVNLGDRSSTVPVTIRNDNPFPVVVEVRLVSAKLRFPPTSEATTVPSGGTAQLRIRRQITQHYVGVAHGSYFATFHITSGARYRTGRFGADA